MKLTEVFTDPKLITLDVTILHDTETAVWFMQQLDEMFPEEVEKIPEKDITRLIRLQDDNGDTGGYIGITRERLGIWIDTFQLHKVTTRRWPSPRQLIYQIQRVFYEATRKSRAGTGRPKISDTEWLDQHKYQ